MNTYLKILFLGASLSLGFSACQNDTPDNTVEEKKVGETPAPASTTTEMPSASLAENKEEIAAKKKKAEALMNQMKKDSVETEKVRVKKEKKEAARELRRKKRKEKRRAERKRKLAEKEAALAAAKAQNDAGNQGVVKNTSVQDTDEIVEEPLSSNNGNARIRFSEMSHDYGIIQQGEEVKHKFKFRNTGTTELVISNVTVSCGCTHPSYPFIPLAPGEEGYIGVHFDSKGRLGKQKPTITVYTNAQPQSYDLHLEGYVDARRESDEAIQDSL